MEIPQDLTAVLRHDGVVAIATLGLDGPHLVNTWNSYVRLTEDGRLLIPAGGMHHTEANLSHDAKVLVSLGSSQVAGQRGPGTGFLIKGQAEFLNSGPDFEILKERFSWARAVLSIRMDSIAQTL